LSSKDVTHKIATLELSFDSHSNSIVFNIIKDLLNFIILRLSWLNKYNLFIDWKLRKVSFSREPLLIEPARKLAMIS